MVKHKYKAKATFIVFILAIALLVYFMQGMTIAGNSATYVIPHYTTLRCDVVDDQRVFEYASFEYQGTPSPQNNYVSSNKYTAIRCDDFTKKCDLYYYMDSAKVTAEKHGLCGVYGEAFICKDNNCNAGLSIMGGLNAWQYLTTLNPGEELRMRRWVNTGLTCSVPVAEDRGAFAVRKYADIYGLIVEGNTPYSVKEGSCSITSDLKGNIKSDDFVTQLYFDRENVAGKRFISYISGYSYATIDNVYSYKGQQVYCTGTNTLYKFGELSLADGTTKVLAPTTLLNADIECCPYITGCGSDFMFKQGIVSCKSSLDCFNQGRFYVTSDGKVVQQSCVSNECKITATKTPVCRSAKDCGDGYCDNADVNPDNWKCVKGTPTINYCGDDVCNGEENLQSCPSDCGSGSDGVCSSQVLGGVLCDSSALLIILGVLAIVVLMFAYKFRGSK